MNKVLLIILDGWGYSEKIEGNAIRQADTPNMDRFCRQYPWSLLDASGEAVGLPPGQMGNSEVGHINLGAGRIVCQELTRIGQCVKSGEFYQNPVLLQTLKKTRDNDSTLHLIGLVSDGGVHSHFDHLLALLEMTRREKIKRVFIHAILDGRDTIPYGARPFLERLQQLCRKHQNGYIATICGRYYAMDRDLRWDRTERAYRAYAAGDGLKAIDPLEALDLAYNRGEADEFVQPTVIIDQEGKPLTIICSEDSVIFFNFRPDRARQISRVFIEEDFSCFDRGSKEPKPYYVTITEYDRSFAVPVVFSLDDLSATLGEIYSRHGLAQMRIAETEKYAHVTFFFNGGREKPFPGEERILVSSPKVATYDLQPEMSAPEITIRIIETVKKDQQPLIIANYANADMVGHSGIISATIKAVQAVDSSLGLITAEVLPRGWHILICADHGNAEQMQNGAGETLTAHSANPVPFLILGPKKTALHSRGILADVAPTILDLAGIAAPGEMTGRSMLVSKQEEG